MSPRQRRRASMRSAIRGASVSSSYLANAHVADREHAIVVPLNANVAAPRPPVVPIRGKLARLDLRFPIGTPQLVLEQLLSVEPMLDVRASRHDPGRVPFARRLHDSRGRGIQR